MYTMMFNNHDIIVSLRFILALGDSVRDTHLSSVPVLDCFGCKADIVINFLLGLEGLGVCCGVDCRVPLTTETGSNEVDSFTLVVLI